MAQYVRHDREQTDPLPLRRVVRQRPLTEDELYSMYGSGDASPYGYGDPSPKPKWGPDRYDSVSPPGVVRPADWDEDVSPVASEPLPPPPPAPPTVDRDTWREPSFPEPSPWVARETFAPRGVYVDDDEEERVALPMRRRRWPWALVAVVVAGAAGVAGYALLGDDVAAELNEPAVGLIDDSRVERAPIPVEAVRVATIARAEPHRGPAVAAAAKEAEAAEAEEEAAPETKKTSRAARPEPNRTYTYQRPTQPAPEPPKSTPYPNLESEKSLDQLNQNVQGELGGSKPEAKPAQPPAEEPPSDLRVPKQYQQEAPAAPKRGIVRDPGF